MHCLRQYEATLWWNHTRMNMWSSFLLLVVLHNTQYGMKIDTSFHLMECHLNLQSQYNNQNDNSGCSINNHRDEFHMALWRYDYFLFWTGIKRMVSVWYAWNIFNFPNIPQATFFYVLPCALSVFIHSDKRAQCSKVPVIAKNVHQYNQQTQQKLYHLIQNLDWNIKEESTAVLLCCSMSLWAHSVVIDFRLNHGAMPWNWSLCVYFILVATKHFVPSHGTPSITNYWQA